MNLSIFICIYVYVSRKNGKGGGDVWLSILGQVFDVTAGAEYYGEGSGYSIFAAQDASPCFASGKFNEEGAKEDIEQFDTEQINSVVHWRKFYDDADQYNFVGLLEGLYYDEKGEPTPKLLRIHEKIAATEQK